MHVSRLNSLSTYGLEIRAQVVRYFLAERFAHPSVDSFNELVELLLICAASPYSTSQLFDLHRPLFHYLKHGEDLVSLGYGGVAFGHQLVV
jgi:hypothetical protein